MVLARLVLSITSKIQKDVYSRESSATSNNPWQAYALPAQNPRFRPAAYLCDASHQTRCSPGDGQRIHDKQTECPSSDQRGITSRSRESRVSRAWRAPGIRSKLCGIGMYVVTYSKTFTSAVPSVLPRHMPHAVHVHEHTTTTPIRNWLLDDGLGMAILLAALPGDDSNPPPSGPSLDHDSASQTPRIPPRRKARL